MAKVNTDAAAGTGATYIEGETVQPTADEYGREVVVIAGGASVTVTGGATEAKQDTGNESLANIDANTDGLETGQAATNTKLDTLLGQTDGLETSATTTATNTGTTATNTGAISSAVVSAESTWSQLGTSVSPTLKSGSGKVWALFIGNLNASTTLYAWVYDNTSATGTPMFPPIPLAAGAWYGIGTDLLTADGKSFSTGLTVGFSTSRSTYSAHSTATDCHAGGFGA